MQVFIYISTTSRGVHSSIVQGTLAERWEDKGVRKTGERAPDNIRTRLIFNSHGVRGNAFACKHGFTECKLCRTMLTLTKECFNVFCVSVPQLDSCCCGQSTRERCRRYLAEEMHNHSTDGTDMPKYGQTDLSLRLAVLVQDHKDTGRLVGLVLGETVIWRGVYDKKRQLT